MKFLYIVRHAKSSWDDPELGDFSRPLNDRGKRDAPRMARRLKEKELTPDLMLASPAKRALSTAKRMARVLAYDVDKIKEDQRLYHADDEVIFSVIQSMKDKHNVLMVFGHNPGLTDFVNSLTSDENNIENVPTCGVVAFELNINQWSQLSPGCGKLIFFDFPKSKED